MFARVHSMGCCRTDALSLLVFETYREWKQKEKRKKYTPRMLIVLLYVININQNKCNLDLTGKVIHAFKLWHYHREEAIMNYLVSTELYFV